MSQHLENFEIPPFEVKKGQAVSLLISNEFYWNKSVLEKIAEHLRDGTNQVAVARPANRGRGLARLLSPKATDRWLAKEIGIDLKSAQGIISALPWKISPMLEHNPGNPRNFISIAAALHTQPDVLIYDSGRMDPSGVMALNDFITSKRENFFAVYINWSCIKSEENCDYTSLPYSEKIWLEPIEEKESS